MLHRKIVVIWSESEEAADHAASTAIDAANGIDGVVSFSENNEAIHFPTSDPHWDYSVAETLDIDIYKEKDDDPFFRHEQMTESIISMFGRVNIKKEDIRVVYSHFERDADQNVTNNIHDIAVKGKCIFQDASGSYTCDPVNNPNWLDVCFFAQQYLTDIDDQHHIYLEHVVDSGKTKNIKGEEIPIYYFSFGS